MASDLYAKFLDHVRDVFRAGSIEEVLGWDQETMMPKRGAEARSHQLALVAGFTHERLTSPELGDMLGKLEREVDPAAEPEAGANVREMRRHYDRAVKIPTDLVKQIARATSLAKTAWIEARRESNFAGFAPHLQKLLDLKREVADKVGWKTEPYDALMDEYEPGARSAEVQAVFDALKAELVPLVAAIKEAPRQPDLSLLTRKCDVGAQSSFSRAVAEAMGFDFDAGRIDTSAHPFCSGTNPGDVRLTTRYNETYFPQALFGTMHEAGHGLYEQGLDPEHSATPMGAAVSLGIHESQSRMWENMVGRGRPFWERFYGEFQKTFPAYADVKPDDFYFAINAVQPSLIRVEADEVTYGLHIMLRFDLERRMIAGKLAVKDVPAAWNDSFKAFLGIAPPDDAKGCLQDIHWSSGIFGYFPTYALGNLYAAQFYAAAGRAIPDLEGQFRKGQFRPLLDWLRKNIHRRGQRYRATELVKVVTGQELSHQPFMEYLNAKFRPLYGL